MPNVSFFFAGCDFFISTRQKWARVKYPKTQILVNLKLRLNKFGQDTQNLKLPLTDDLTEKTY